MQVKRELKPALDAAGVKLFLLGIGTPESAREFAGQLDLPPEIMLADDAVATYQALKTVNSKFEEDGRQKGMRMITGNTWDAVKSRKGGRPLTFFGLFDLPFLTTNDDLEAVKPGGDIYRPLLPQGENSAEKSMVLGGVFVFEGQRLLYRHKDKNVGTHADFQAVLDACTKA